MPAKGYSSNSAVAAYLGVTLTAGQITQCDALILDVEAYIDRECRRGWLGGAVTDEVQTVRRNLSGYGFVFLNNYPVTSVQSVRVRSTAFDATDTTLTLNATSDGYQVRDLVSGLILMSGAYQGYLARVSYTPVAALPADLGLAATMLTAHWLQAALQPETAGIESYSIGQDLTVKYRSSAGYSIPSKVQDIIGSYRRSVV